MAKSFTTKQKRRRSLFGHKMAHDHIGKRPVKIAVSDRKQRVRGSGTGRRRGGG